MASVNKVILVANVGADPEIRRTQSGTPIANLRVATSESWRDKNSGEKKEKTEWHTVVVFNEGLCKVVEAYVKKGSKLYIEGALQTRKWQDSAGNDRYSTEVVLQGFNSTLTMLDGPSDDKQDRSGGDYAGKSGKDSPSQKAAKNSHQAPYREPDDYVPATTYDDDIPFAPEWRG